LIDRSIIAFLKGLPCARQASAAIGLEADDARRIAAAPDAMIEDGEGVAIIEA
jgi:hypothetical protein